MVLYKQKKENINNRRIIKMVGYSPLLIMRYGTICFDNKIEFEERDFFVRVMVIFYEGKKYNIVLVNGNVIFFE
jgi:hypothetical protein